LTVRQICKPIDSLRRENRWPWDYPDAVVQYWSGVGLD